MNEGATRTLLSVGQLGRYVIGLCASVGFLGGCGFHNEVNASKYPPTMVRLGPASFWMGTDESEIPKLMLRYPDLPADVFLPEAPRRFVRLNSFSLDRYEVTKAQFREFLVADPSWRPMAVPAPSSNGSYLRDWSGLDYPRGQAKWPATYITWYAASAFCKWRGGRLPTEAEWEYAAHGGVDDEFPWGNQPPNPTSANGAALQ